MSAPPHPLAQMRLLHVADLHFRREWFAWLSRRAPEFDAVCIAGDLLDMFPGARTDIHNQARWVRAWLQGQPGPLFVCSGNHDLWPESLHVVDTDAEGGWLQKARRPGRVFVDGDSRQCDLVRISCTRWGAIPEPFAGIPNIVLVHAPPEGTPIALECGNDVGDAQVLSAAQRLPAGSIILSGHVHDPRRWYARIGATLCLNPGVDRDAACPNHVVIDLAARRVHFEGWGQSLSEAI